ncbi:MAG: DNA repair protein RecO, partial [Clostridia bacterium]|nr:DNA repair protein RecO [Clostridia bacterium]
MESIIQTRGIVLHKLRYSDTSLIVKIYTEALGLQSYLIRGISGKRAPGKMAQFEPLSLLEVVAYNRLGHNLQYIKEVRSIHPYQNIPFDFVRNAILLFLNEILYKVIREEESNAPLFHYIWDMLIHLDQEATPVRDFPILFLIRLIPYLGFAPLDNADGSRKCFSMKEGSFFRQDSLDESLVAPQL